MSAILIIVILIGLLLALVLFIKHKLFMDNLYWHFKHVNVITFGKKGSGKDLVTDKVIRHRKEFYYANIPYSHEDYEVVKLKQVSCEPNNYENIVNDKIVKQPHQFKEGKDIYISDIGIYLPSYMDNKLYNKFPSMPILYALSRQLYNNNIHCNTQNLERGWKALREQADFYVRCKRTYKLPFLLITSVVTYDKYDSAKKALEPIRSRMLNKYSKAEVDIYKAENGEIRKGLIFSLKRKVKYDSRYFEKVLLEGERLT